MTKRGMSQMRTRQLISLRRQPLHWRRQARVLTGPLPRVLLPVLPLRSKRRRKSPRRHVHLLSRHCYCLLISVCHKMAPLVTGLISFITIIFSHLHYNTIQHFCKAILQLLAANCVNCKKGLFPSVEIFFYGRSSPSLVCLNA